MFGREKPKQTGWSEKQLKPLRENPVIPSGNEKLHVSRIEGIEHAPAALEKDRKVIIHCTDSQGKWYEIHVPFEDAMYLLNGLRKVEEESGFAPINRPPSAS